jgi:hypothetical protein
MFENVERGRVDSERNWEMMLAMPHLLGAPTSNFSSNILSVLLGLAGQRACCTQ